MSLFVGSCAKVGSPSGGTKDTIPPIVVRATPPNESVNFSEKQFVLEFDEYVTITDVSSKLMVSPPFRQKPTVSMRGKNVIVKFEDELAEETTYTFYLQDGVKDLNESNSLENLQYVFSTGSAIDSLSVDGKVYDAYTLQPLSNISVLLYGNLHDTAFSTVLPNYLIQTNKEGYFRIDHIRDGAYNMFAISDQDNSKNFNNIEEPIAFLDSVINISSLNGILAVDPTIPDSLLTGQYALYMFTHDKTDRYLLSSSRNRAYQLTYKLSLPPENYPFEFAISDTPKGGGYLLETNAKRDSLTVWITDSTLYNRNSLVSIVSYPYTDSTDNIIQRTDTIPLRFTTQSSSRNNNSPVLLVDTTFTITTNMTGTLTPIDTISLLANMPISNIDTSKIQLFERVDSLKNPISFTIERDSLNARMMRVYTTLGAGKSYNFVADSLSFENIYGIFSDSIGYNFTVGSPEQYATITIDISQQADSIPIILQLLSADGRTVVRESSPQDNKVVFPYLPAAKYKLRLIYDLDGDGKWTTGLFDEKRQPEKVIFFPREIETKANWEQDYEWEIVPTM